MHEAEEIVHVIAGYIALALDAVAMLLVAYGAVRALVRISLVSLEGRGTEAQVRRIFIHFARWLVAALTFQLGADIVGTAIAPNWDELGQLAVVAGIRTFLTYFLDRDLERAQEHAHGES